MTVTPIGAKRYTPEVLVSAISEDLPQIDQIFCVAFAKDGQIFQYHSGDIKSMSLASIVLQDMVCNANPSIRTSPPGSP